MQPKPMRAVYNTPMRRSLLLCSWLTNEFAKFTNRQNQSVRYAFYYVYVCPTSAPRGFRYGYRRYKGNIFISYSFFFYRQNVFLWSDLTLLNTNISKKSSFPWFFAGESTYKKCLREEWGKFTGYQLLSSFWLKVTRTDEDGNTTRWDRGTLPIRNLYPKWGMLRFGRMRKVTNWIWTLWFIVSYWWVT